MQNPARDRLIADNMQMAAACAVTVHDRANTNEKTSHRREALPEFICNHSFRATGTNTDRMVQQVIDPRIRTS
jgi:hypothetical protein